MPDRQNVVPFQQDAGFFARRALKKQKNGSYQEAVVLLRRALEAAPGNAEYLLDLAETYSEMGCPLESNRCLLRLLTDFPERTICWFALACNLFSAGNVQGAQGAAQEYLGREPEGEYSQQAADMLTAIQQAREIHEPADRRLKRCWRLNERAAAALNREQPNAAVRLIEQSLAFHESPDTRGLYAFALGEAGRLNEAAREAKRLLRRKRLPVGIRINVLRALVAAGEFDLASGVIAALDERDIEPYELRRVLEALFAIRGDRSIQPRLSRALRLSPFDRALLHAQAAVFYNENDAETALVWWRHMLEINPSDPIALAYVGAVVSDSPPATPIPLSLSLLPALADAQRRLIREEKDEAAVMQACRWSLLDGDTVSAFAAAERLASLECPESETLLREALIEPAILPAVKMAVQEALRQRGTHEPWFVIGRDFLTTGEDSERRGWPVHILRKRVLEAFAMDEALLFAFLARWGLEKPPVRRGFRSAQELSRALLAGMANECGVGPARIEEALNCSRRRLSRWLRQYNRMTGGHTDT